MTAPIVEELASRPRGLRPPRPDGPPHEASVAAANATARADSIALLAEALPDLDVELAAGTTDAGTFAVGTVGPHLQAELDGYEILDRVLGGADLSHPRLRLIRDTVELDVGALLAVSPGATGRATVRFGALAAYLDGGATVVLDALDRKHVALQRLAEHVERAFGSGINMNGYLSLRRHQSFGAHWDPHEVTVLQLLGRKHWELHAPPALSPHKSIHGDDTTGQVVWQGEVGPGTALRIPRGWGHRVTGLDELTFHVTFTMPRPTGLTVAERALEEADPGADLSMVLQGSGPEASGAVQAALAAAGSPGSVAHQLSQTRVELPSRPTGSIASTVRLLAGGDPTGVLVRAPLPGGIHLADEADGRVAVGAARRWSTIPTSTLTWLAPALDGRARPRAGLPGQLGGTADPAAEAAVDALLVMGLLEPCTPGWGVVTAP